MLDDPGADLRDLEHLTARHGDHRSVGEPVTTPGTRGRLMQHGLVRDLDLGRLVSATYPLDRYRDALDHAANAGARGAVKIAFEMRGEKHR